MSVEKAAVNRPKLCKWLQVKINGPVAQLIERFVRNEEVVSLILIGSTSSQCELVSAIANGEGGRAAESPTPMRRLPRRGPSAEGGPFCAAAACMNDRAGQAQKVAYVSVAKPP